MFKIFPFPLSVKRGKKYALLKWFQLDFYLISEHCIDFYDLSAGVLSPAYFLSRSICWQIYWLTPTCVLGREKYLYSLTLGNFLPPLSHQTTNKWKYSTSNLKSIYSDKLFQASEFPGHILKITNGVVQTII